jgi:hypothetical protein
MGQSDQDYVRQAACRCGPPSDVCVVDDEVLTHHAKIAGEFLNAPRLETEREVSLLRGKLTVEEATRYRYRRGSAAAMQAAVDKAGVRYTTAGQLRHAGFAVVHTPGRMINGPHVSVVWPADDPLERQDIPWPDHVTARFADCFIGDY